MDGNIAVVFQNDPSDEEAMTPAPRREPSEEEVDKMAFKLDELVHPEWANKSTFYELPEDEQEAFIEAARYVLSLLDAARLEQAEADAQLAESIYSGDEGTNSYEYGEDGLRLAKAIRSASRREG